MSKGNFDLVRLLWQRKVRRTRKMQKVSGVPPLQYSAKEQGTLKNYRIYGNTVGGESVGDRTGNLFDESSSQYGNDLHWLPTGSLVYSDTYYGSPIMDVTGLNTITRSYTGTGANYFLTSDLSQFVNVSNVGTVDAGVTVNVPDGYTEYVFNIPNTIRPDSIMVNSGSEPLPYEPYGYKVPVTVSNDTDTQTIPIYLPEQIRKVGDEAEYIDYGEQKMHRVRANYLQTSDFEDGAIFTGQDWKNLTYQESKTPPGMIDPGLLDFDTTRKRFTNLITIIGTYTISIADGWEFGVVMFPNDRNSGDLFIYNTEPVTISNCTFAIQIRKTDVSDISSADISDYKIMLNKGSTALPYEPYIENTDLDVTLPALPTLTGTNVLSVRTAVQPSRVEVKGRIKAVGQETEPEPEAAEAEQE